MAVSIHPGTRRSVDREWFPDRLFNRESSALGDRMPADLKAIYERMHAGDAAAWRPRVLRPHAWTTHRYDDVARLLAAQQLADELACGR